MAFALAAGIFVAVIGNLIAAPIINILGVPAEVKPYSVTYLRLYFSGAPFIMLYNFEAAIFRSNGNTRTPLICLFIGGVFNVAANLFFVLVLGMDVDGVAIATVLANVISSMLLLYFLRKEDSVIHVNIAKIRFNRDDLHRDIRILRGEFLHPDSGDFHRSELRCRKVRAVQGSRAQDPHGELDFHDGAFCDPPYIRKTSARPVHERAGGNRGWPAQDQAASLCRNTQRADGQSVRRDERSRKVAGPCAHHSHLRMRGAYHLGVYRL